MGVIVYIPCMNYLNPQGVVGKQEKETVVQKPQKG